PERMSMWWWCWREDSGRTGHDKFDFMRKLLNPLQRLLQLANSPRIRQVSRMNQQITRGDGEFASKRGAVVGIGDADDACSSLRWFGRIGKTARVSGGDFGETMARWAQLTGLRSKG